MPYILCHTFKYMSGSASNEERLFKQNCRVIYLFRIEAGHQYSKQNICLPHIQSSSPFISHPRLQHSSSPCHEVLQADIILNICIYIQLQMASFPESGIRDGEKNSAEHVQSVLHSCPNKYHWTSLKSQALHDCKKSWTTPCLSKVLSPSNLKMFQKPIQSLKYQSLLWCICWEKCLLLQVESSWRWNCFLLLLNH